MEEKTNELRLISVSDIVPHPENPRKDVGDVTELADSIKANGIMQNLTVVPHEEDGRHCYRVIIGHRRLAAAKAAGLEKVPCVVSDMDYQTQIATMLSENMQRVDLTLPEQVFGIQMMFDLGASEDEIQKSTGLSKKTVRQRRSIAKLGEDTVKTAYEKGATLEEYVKLGKIKDEYRRQNLLVYVGDSNFEWAYKNAIDAEKREKKLERLENKIATIARKVDTEPEFKEYEEIESIWIGYGAEDTNDPDISEYKDIDGLVYYMSSYYLRLYRERTEEEKAQITKESAERAAEEKSKKERVEKLKAVASQCRAARKSFVKEHTEENPSELGKLVAYLLTEQIVKNSASIEDIRKCLPVKKGDEIYGYIESHPIQALLALLISSLEKTYGFGELFWYNSTDYQKSDTLNKLYEFLEGIGYEKADEEDAYLNGTHEAYTQK